MALVESVILVDPTVQAVSVSVNALCASRVVVLDHSHKRLSSRMRTSTEIEVKCVGGAKNWVSYSVGLSQRLRILRIFESGRVS